MNNRGGVLVHVLVTGVIMALIASGLLRMTLLNYTATARAASGAQERGEADAALSKTISRWNQNNAVCSNNITGYTCTGVAGTCSCTCTPADSGLPVIVASVSGGVCRVSFTTVDGP